MKNEVLNFFQILCLFLGNLYLVSILSNIQTSNTGSNNILKKILSVNGMKIVKVSNFFSMRKFRNLFFNEQVSIAFIIYLSLVTINKSFINFRISEYILYESLVFIFLILGIYLYLLTCFRTNFVIKTKVDNTYYIFFKIIFLVGISYSLNINNNNLNSLMALVAFIYSLRLIFNYILREAKVEQLVHRAINILFITGMTLILFKVFIINLGIVGKENFILTYVGTLVLLVWPILRAKRKQFELSDEEINIQILNRERYSFLAIVIFRICLWLA